MATEPEDIKQEDEQELSEEEKKLLRGKRAPRVPFELAIGYFKKLVANGGASGTSDDLSKAVSSNAPKGGTYDVRKNSMVSLDLIKMNTKDTYSLTALGGFVASGIPEVEKEAIKKAFLAIPTIRKIWDTFKAGLLPNTTYSFGNSLVLRLPEDIPNIGNTPQMWAEYFLQGVKYAGLTETRSNGLYLMSKEPNPEGIAAGREQDDSLGEKNDLALSKSEEQRFIQTLFSHPSNTVSYSKMLSGERMLNITLPENPSPEEAQEIIDRAKFVIKSMKGFLEQEE